jgi:hypothetical protein
VSDRTPGVGIWDDDDEPPDNEDPEFDLPGDN